MKSTSNLIDINKKKGLPRSYRFNQFIRWTTLLLGLAAIAYALWVVFSKIDIGSPKFFKLVPFIIIFLAANSVMRNLFSLNSILFTEKKIVFKFIARKSVAINWKTIIKMEFGSTRHRVIHIFYREGDKDKKFLMNLSFPNMVEIINSIAELCDGVEYDDFLKKVIIEE